MLLKLISKDSVADKIETLQVNFEGDYDPNSLTAELELFPVTGGVSQLIKLGYLVKVIQSLSHEKRELIRNVAVIIRINLTNGEASATPIRSFSILR